MKRGIALQMTRAALFLALCVLIPYAVGHAAAIPGTVLLPMHLPVLLCGLLCGPVYGGAVGLAAPLLSHLLTGMPAAGPMIPIMAAQMLVLGASAGLFTGWLQKIPALPKTAAQCLAMLPALLCGWTAYALMFASLTVAADNPLKAATVWTAVITGIPGLIVQLTLAPAVLLALTRARGRRTRGAEAAPADALLAQARALIMDGSASCVIIKNGVIAHTAAGRGVTPILQLLEQQPELLRDAFVVDKIIGKAAAMLLTLAGAARLYGEITSTAARDWLLEQRIPAGWGRCVDVISARDGQGICPIEKSVLELQDAALAPERIRTTLETLRRSAG